MRHFHAGADPLGEDEAPADACGGPPNGVTRPGASGIDFWTARADGSDRQPVLTGVAVADPGSVTLSADRQAVFFVAPVEGDTAMAQAMTGDAPADLHVAEVGGGKPRRLANRHPFKQRFAVSPDGRQIAYEVGQDVRVLSGAGRSELWLMTR